MLGCYKVMCLAALTEIRQTAAQWYSSRGCVESVTRPGKLPILCYVFTWPATASLGHDSCTSCIQVMHLVM